MTSEHENINLCWSLSRFSASTAASPQFKQKILELKVAGLLLLSKSKQANDRRESQGHCLQGERTGEQARPSPRGRTFGPGLVIGVGVELGDVTTTWLLIRALDGICKDVVLLVMDAN